MQDQPTRFPTARPDGSPLKPLTDVLLELRPTSHFLPDAVADEYLQRALCRVGENKHVAGPQRGNSVRAVDCRRSAGVQNVAEFENSV